MYGAYDLDAMQRQIDNMRQQMAQNPFGQPAAPVVRSPPAEESNIVWAEGLEGAKAFRLNPNAKALLLDSENEGVFYIKTCDSVGMCKMRKFRFTEEPMETPQEREARYVTREDVQQIILEMLGKAGNNDQTVSGA